MTHRHPRDGGRSLGGCLASSVAAFPAVAHMEIEAKSSRAALVAARTGAAFPRPFLDYRLGGFVFA